MALDWHLGQEDRYGVDNYLSHFVLILLLFK